jgi:hypothetical protein
LRIEKKTHHASGKKCFGLSAGFEPATFCFLDRCSTE